MPRPGLTRERIIAAAVAMADEQGLAAVTLRGLARRLRVHVTSLYNHIPTKDALLTGMTEALVEEADLPLGEMSWQDWIRRFALAMRGLARRHPGAFQLFQEGPAQSEPALRSVESAVAAFDADGFDAVSTYSAIRAVNVAVLGLVLGDLMEQRQPAETPDPDLLPPDRYPGLHRIQAATDDRVDTFAYLVDTLVDGIAANRRSGRLLPDAD